MYQLKQKKKRFLINSILDSLYDWAVEIWEKNYASYRVQKWSNEPDEEICTNENEFASEIYYAINNELKDEFESEIRSYIQDLASGDAGRIMKWMGLYLDKELNDYPIDALQDDDGFMTAIKSKFVYKKLNIIED